jgi:hypothetical protein
LTSRITGSPASAPGAASVGFVGASFINWHGRNSVLVRVLTAEERAHPRSSRGVHRRSCAACPAGSGTRGCNLAARENASNGAQ